MASAALKGALGLVIALVLGVALAALVGVGPLAGMTPASSVTDPREMTARALQAVMDADSVHIDAQVYGTLPGYVLDAPDLVVDLEGTAADADIRPKDVRTRLHLEVPVADIALDTVSSWDTLWSRTGPDGAWTRGSVAEVVSAADLDANPLTLVDALRAALARLPAPTLDNVPCAAPSGTCREVVIDGGTTAGEVVRHALAAASGVDLPPLYLVFTLQADTETLRPVQLDIDVISQDGTADMRIMVEFSGWNEAVTIEEPVPG